MRFTIRLASLLALILCAACTGQQTEPPASSPQQESQAPTTPEPPTEPPEPTKASQSIYNRNIRLATTSEGLTLADLAWHAVNTYGWDCQEVISRGEQQGDFYVITCSNGTKLRVYPRPGQHPRITNDSGGYD